MSCKGKTQELDSTPPILFEGKTKNTKACSFSQHFSLSLILPRLDRPKSDLGFEHYLD